MILGVGVDIVSIDRMAQVLKKSHDRFLQRVFTGREIEDALLRKERQNVYSAFFAKRFAAKEAFAKAVGCGIGGVIAFKDIEICNNSLGRPFIDVCSEAKRKLIKFSGVLEFPTIHLSITDDSNVATAFVVLEAVKS